MLYPILGWSGDLQPEPEMCKNSNNSFGKELRGFIIAVFAAILVSLPCPAFADIIHLINGGKLKGRIVSENEKEIVFQKGSIRTTILRTEISHIERTSGSSIASGRNESGNLEKQAKELFDKTL